MAETVAVERFVREMTRSYAGREMAERVFRSLTQALAGHAACLTDHELATYLLDHDWTFAQVQRRES